MLDLEHMDDEYLERLRDIYERLGTKAQDQEKQLKGRANQASNNWRGI
jgi:hypothetical protein